MNDIERYEQAKLAVDAGSALYLLEAAATLLGRFLLATRGVWLNLNTRDQHAE